MPHATISGPVAADSIERLTLGAIDARSDAVMGSGFPYNPPGVCMADE